MATVVQSLGPTRANNTLVSGQLPKWALWAILVGSLVLSTGFFAIVAVAGGGEFSIVGALVVAAVVHVIAMVTISMLAEGRRRAVDRLVTALVIGAFLVAMAPLVSVTWTVVAAGIPRFDVEFFTHSMRSVNGPGGGALHAIVGTLEITLVSTLISVPIGLLTSIYLVEYGRGRLARAITFLVDVMTGIPSIVAGLFAFALFTMIVGPRAQSGLAGAIALSVLMIPVVVRSSEEMLRIVPNELREASLALGVPKWATIMKVVLPTSVAGIATGVVLAIARVIGETAPLLLAAGFTNNMNYDMTQGPMQTLPLFVYTSYRSSGGMIQEDIDRAWTGALVLILIVLALNLIARLIAKLFAPKTGR